MCGIRTLNLELFGPILGGGDFGRYWGGILADRPSYNHGKVAKFAKSEKVEVLLGFFDQKIALPMIKKRITWNTEGILE